MGDVLDPIHAHATMDGKETYVKDVCHLANSLCTLTISMIFLHFQQFAIHLVFTGPAQLRMFVLVTLGGKAHSVMTVRALS